MFFKNFEDATYYLRIEKHTACVFIYQCKESYEYFTHKNRILYCIGQGPKRSHGHPSGNQHSSRQQFTNGDTNQWLYPVFKAYSNCVEYVGDYKLVSYKKEISFEGFVYFQYKMMRHSISKLDPKRLAALVLLDSHKESQ